MFGYDIQISWGTRYNLIRVSQEKYVFLMRHSLLKIHEMPEQFLSEASFVEMKAEFVCSQAWMPILKPLVHVGFGFSLLSLLIAFGILATSK